MLVRSRPCPASLDMGEQPPFRSPPLGTCRQEASPCQAGAQRQVPPMQPSGRAGRAGDRPGTVQGTVQGPSGQGPPGAMRCHWLQPPWRGDGMAFPPFWPASRAGRSGRPQGGPGGLSPGKKPPSPSVPCRDSCELQAAAPEETYPHGPRALAGRRRESASGSGRWAGLWPAPRHRRAQSTAFVALPAVRVRRS